MDDRETLDRFIRHLRVQENFAEKTIERYQRTCERWLLFLRTLAVAPLAATEDQATDWVAMLRSEGSPPASIAHTISSMKRFYHWLCRGRKTKVSPFAELKRPKVVYVMRPAMTTEEMQVVLDAPNRLTFQDLRDSALLLAMYSSAARLTELRMLDLQDLYLERGQLVIRHGKGGTSRIATLQPPAVTALKLYLESAREMRSHRTQAVFVGARGNRICKQAVYEAVRRAGKRAGLCRPIHPHAIRKAVATHLLDNGMDIRHVQEVLGHAKISTTQIYTHVSRVILERELGEHHPLAPASQNGEAVDLLAEALKRAIVGVVEMGRV